MLHVYNWQYLFAPKRVVNIKQIELCTASHSPSLKHEQATNKTDLWLSPFQDTGWRDILIIII